MRDGDLVVKFESGQIIGVHQGPGFERIYEALFRNAYRSAKSSHSV